MPKLVLCAEDDANDVLLMRRAMKKLGGEVKLQFVHNSGEVIERLEGSSSGDAQAGLPDAIVLDVRASGTSGFDALRWIRQNGRFRGLPVIIHSGAMNAADWHKALALGADVFFEKDYTCSRLVEYLARLFDIDGGQAHQLA
jgi:CheY-like chemotaxis protein